MARENQPEPASIEQKSASRRPTPPPLRFVREGFGLFHRKERTPLQPPCASAEASKPAAPPVRPTPPPLQYRKLGHPPREK